jgi:glycerate 2-kinase
MLANRGYCRHRYNSAMPDAPLRDSASDMRAVAQNLFQRALTEGSIDRAFQGNVGCERGVLRVCEDLYDLNSYGRVFVVSIGKAAHSMVEALQNQAGDRFEGIIAGPQISAPQFRGFRYFHGGHPMPNSESIHAAHAVLKSLGSLDPASLVIYLLSGGGSSMLEEPVDDEIRLEDVIATYRVLVNCGAPIAAINAIRKHLSAVKGGRLARAAHPAQQVSLLVSDVPDNTPDALASGPTMPDTTSIENCYDVVSKYGLLEQFPPTVRELFQRRALDETPKSGDSEFNRCRWWTVLSNATLLEEARGEAERLGFHAEVDITCDDWDYLRARDYLLGRLRSLREKAERVCLISGGEVTVRVTNGGIGGRNQQFALSCAPRIAGENITILSIGTDGVDGNSPAAGAIVDGSTLERGKQVGLDAEASLGSFDAYTFFNRVGDTIATGPTGNNLRDLRILLAY